MTRTGGRAIAIALLAVWAGCAGQAPLELDPARLGPARDIVAASLTALGGMERWRQAHAINAQAIVRMIDPNGQAWITFQRQEIDVAGGRLSALADSGNGQWRAVVDTRGRLPWGTRGLGPDSQRRRQVTESLSLLLRRVQGPFALLTGPVMCVSAEPLRLEGKRLLRVGVEAAETGETAYYFDPVTGLLRYVTAGSEQPGGDGTVTIYEYAMLANGVTFPTRIRVVKVGKYALIGDQALLEVDYGSVKFD